MKPNKTLKPLALALPGLFAAYAHAWTLTQQSSGSPWFAGGIASSGYTDAYYSGTSIDPIYGLNEGYNVGTSQWDDKGHTGPQHGVTFLQESYTWNSSTYSEGESNVNNSGDTLRPGAHYLPGGNVLAADSDVS